MILPALSLTQPWCEMVLDPRIGNIENRVWNCHKRGPFLIHAAQGLTVRGYTAAVDFAHTVLSRVQLGERTVLIPHLRNVKRGGIVGAAEIIDVVPLDRLAQTKYRPRHPRANSPWLMDGCFGFVLGRRVRLPFRAYSGRQRWFNVEVTAAEEATLRAAGLVTS